MKSLITCADVVLRPRYFNGKSRSDGDLSNNGFSLPIFASPMDTVYSKQLDKFLTSQKIPVVVHRYFADYKEQLAAAYEPKCSRYRYFAIGALKGSQGKPWIDGLLDAGIKHFCIDMAHGHSQTCINTIIYLKDQMGNLGSIMAGNVATGEGFVDLEEAGADYIRCGVGSGSICSTRLNSGFGIPLLSTLEECAAVARKAFIIADGGIKYNGDIAKCMAFGADFCMLGRQFAATDLSPGLVYDENLKETIRYNPDESCNCWIPPKYIQYRGMASSDARRGVLKEASEEGVSGLIPYTGTTESFLKKLKLNLEAALTYGGVNNWGDFKKYVKYELISHSSWNESLTSVL